MTKLDICLSGASTMLEVHYDGITMRLTVPPGSKREDVERAIKKAQADFGEGIDEYAGFMQLKKSAKRKKRR